MKEYRLNLAYSNIVGFQEEIITLLSKSKLTAEQEGELSALKKLLKVAYQRLEETKNEED